MLISKLLLLAGATIAMFNAAAIGQEPASSTEPEIKLTKATYLMTGLHCPPCTQRVESSLKDAKGVVDVKVDWPTKTAHIEFDETVLSAQKVAQLIAATPHVMGASLKYGAWLALRAPEIKDAASGQTAEQAVAAVDGVTSAKAYPEQHLISTYFGEKGNVTTQQLIDALKQAGMHAENY